MGKFAYNKLGFPGAPQEKLKECQYLNQEKKDMPLFFCRSPGPTLMLLNLTSLGFRSSFPGCLPTATLPRSLSVPQAESPLFTLTKYPVRTLFFQGLFPLLSLQTRAFQLGSLSTLSTHTANALAASAPAYIYEFFIHPNLTPSSRLHFTLPHQHP